MQPGKGEIARRVGVLGIKAEHALIIADRLLEALELEQRIGAPVQGVGGLSGFIRTAWS